MRSPRAAERRCRRVMSVESGVHINDKYDGARWHWHLYASIITYYILHNITQTPAKCLNTRRYWRGKKITISKKLSPKFFRGGDWGSPMVCMLDRLGDPKNACKNLPPASAGRGRTWTSATPPKISNPHIWKKKFCKPSFYYGSRKGTHRRTTVQIFTPIVRLVSSNRWSNVVGEFVAPGGFYLAI